MKKFLFFIIVMAMSISASAEDLALNLMMKDGKVHSFLLSATPTVTIANDQLVITSDDATVSYSLYDVNRYTFGSYTSGINGVKASDANISRNGNNIIFGGIADGNVTVNSIDGKPANADVTTDSGNTVVSLNSLNSGLYIVKVNNVVIKVTKK